MLLSPAAPGPPPTQARSAQLLSQTPGDAGFLEIVGGHFHFHAITGDEADETFAHFSADGGKHHMFIIEFDAEHRPGEYGVDAAFDFYSLFFHS